MQQEDKSKYEGKVLRKASNEFLTERTFIEDFNKQTMVFTGAHELLTKIFVGKKFTVMSPLEAELTKYMHNVFGAYKVTYFNA